MDDSLSVHSLYNLVCNEITKFGVFIRTTLEDYYSYNDSGYLYIYSNGDTSSTLYPLSQGQHIRVYDINLQLVSIISERHWDKDCDVDVYFQSPPQ